MPDRKPKREVDQGEHAPRTCTACGRTMTWRKAWAKNWDEVKFCSDACRKHRSGSRPGEPSDSRSGAQDRELEGAILRLLAERGAGKTICPSEAARAVANSEAREAWDPLMQPARAAARRLVAEGLLVITQGGQVVDPSTAKGAIRLRLR